MKSDLDKKLQEAVEAVKRKEKIQIHLRQLDQLLKERKAEFRLLNRSLQKEKDDYERIKSAGLRRVFYHLLGDLKSAIDKEQQEYLMAFMKRQRCEQAIVDMEKEKELLEGVLSSLHLAEKELDRLLERKKIAIPLKNPALKKQLSLIDKKIFGHYAKKREVKEAIAAGKKAKRQLVKIKEDLEQVRGWGSMDISSAGFGSVKKKMYIDRAQSDANKADALLLEFQKELHDISKQYKIAYQHEIHVLHDFLHQYFNNLIIDWVLKKKIKNTVIGIDQTMDSIDLTLITLEQEQKKIRAYIAEEKKNKKILMMGIDRK
ncbi:MAG: hypothetical protein AB8F74_13760 [Saprospiraceae bacterium]